MACIDSATALLLVEAAKKSTSRLKHHTADLIEDLPWFPSRDMGGEANSLPPANRLLQGVCHGLGWGDGRNRVERAGFSGTAFGCLHGGQKVHECFCASCSYLCTGGPALLPNAFFSFSSSSSLR